MKRKYLMLACPNMKEEILRIMQEYHLDYEVVFLPEQLHQSPDHLREYLDSYLKELTDVETVILPMGRCGNGTLGVHSYMSTLILPRCEDCINLLLSREKLSEVVRPEKTYFFTDGWLNGDASFIREYEYTMQRFGEETGKDVSRMIYGNYDQFAYIDTGTGDFEEAAAKVEPLAECIQTEIRCLEGPHGVLKKMVCCEFDSENFITILPDSVVSEKDWEDV